MYKKRRPEVTGTGLDPIPSIYILYSKKMNEGIILEAYEYLQMGEYIKCITLCNKILVSDPHNDAALALKVQAITEQNTYSDIDLMVDNGTVDIMNTNTQTGQEIIKASLLTATGNTKMNMTSIRTSQVGKTRPGYMRPETQLSISGVMSHDNIRKALKTGRTTAVGSRIRTTTAQTTRLATTAVNSALGMDGIDIVRMDPKIYTNNLLLRYIICDFLLFVQKNTISALELLGYLETSSNIPISDPWWITVRKGIAHLISGRINDAERLLKQGNNITPRTIIILLLGNIALRRGQMSSAINIYDGGILSFNQSQDLDLAIARIYEMMGDRELALRMYEKVLEQDPSCVEAISCAASLCMELKKLEKAFNLYTRLSIFGVKDPGLSANLSICFQLMGDTTNALWFQIKGIEMAESYLSQHGEETEDYSFIVADMWYNAGLLFCYLADFFAASKCFDTALKHYPNHPEATTGAAYIALNRGRKLEADKILERLIDQDDAPAEGLLGSAIMALDKGDIELALTNAQKALFRPRGSNALRVIHAIKERILMK